MPRSSPPPGVALCGLLCLLACKDSEGEPRTPQGANRSLEWVTATYCERLLGCPGGKLQAYDLETCLRADSFQWCADVRNLPDVSECVRAIRETDCRTLLRRQLVPGCEPVRQAIVDSAGASSLAGGLCVSNIHCPVDMRCEISGEDCAGSCVPLVAEGEPCEDFSDCQLELSCSPARVCARPLLAGARCTWSFQCESGECVLGTCRETKELLGRLCLDQSDCGRFLRCDDGFCRERAAPGERCAESSDCYPGLACIDERCELTVACHAGQRGDPCMDDRQCQGSLRCDGAQRRCVPAPRRGDPCSFELSCGEGLACTVPAGGGGTCGVPVSKANGEACDAFWQCASDFCAQGECGEPVACEP